MGARADAKAATRAKVLAAATKLFTDRGFTGTDIRSIAREAGMSTGAVFASFTDKEELWREATGLPTPEEALAAWEVLRTVAGAPMVMIIEEDEEHVHLYLRGVQIARVFSSSPAGVELLQFDAQQAFATGRDTSAAYVLPTRQPEGAAA